MSRTAHCVMGNNSMRCLNCGSQQEIAMPSSLRVMAAIGQAFVAEHRACQPTERGAARMRYSDHIGWVTSWDTGESSLAIYRFMSGGLGAGSNPAIPHDPSDFGRCFRLLAVEPEWRARMLEMASIKAWAPFVLRWAELEALYQEEAPSGSCPKLFEALKQCRRA